MENIILRQHMDYLIQCTKKLQLSDCSLNRYICRYEEVFEYCCGNNCNSFTFNELDDFLITACKNKKKYFVRETIKIAYTVASYFESGEFKWLVVTQPNYPISNGFKNLRNEFSDELLKTLSAGTVRTGIGIVQQFLYYVDQLGKHEVEQLTDEDILNFVRNKAPFHKQSMSKLLRTMRKFIGFLNKKKNTNLTADRFLTDAGRCRQKVLPCFTDEEIQAIFSKIDRTTDKGRRDYAVFLLALRTGLRASDISKIKLSDIDWKRNCIKVVQKKTHVALELPLPIDAGNAIADYILNSRYESDSTYVFLRIKKTNYTGSIDPTAFNTYLQSYMKEAGIKKSGWDGKSFHAFRRTVGTRMVETNTPVTTVAQVLGHGSLESSKRYIALDTQKLRDCSLELGALHTRKEGLV